MGNLKLDCLFLLQKNFKKYFDNKNYDFTKRETS